MISSLSLSHHSLYGEESDRLNSQNEEESKEFRRKLRKIDTTHKSTEKISEILKEIVSSGYKSEEIAISIFDNCYKYNIVPLINALRQLDSDFKLSPFDQMRYVILEDKDQVLNRGDFTKYLTDLGVEKDHDFISKLYQFAYDKEYSPLYEPSSRAIALHEYTLNFLWVNLNPQDRIRNEAQHIFQDGLNPAENSEYINNPAALRSMEKNDASLLPHEAEQWESIQKSFLYRLSKWADLHPGGSINLWYDSALVTQQAQAKTFEMLKGMAQSRGVNLQLRDIRQLSNLKDELLNLMHPAVPVYVRVDLLKVLISDYMLSSPQEKAKYCVVTDIDVAPMPPPQLWDRRTLDNLDSSGYVFNKVGVLGFENSFFIFNKEKEGLQEIHRKTMMDQINDEIEYMRSRSHLFAPLKYKFIFSHYVSDSLLGSTFLSAIKDQAHGEPRKIVKCPKSQFALGGEFCLEDHQSEEFRFIGSESVPETKYGRSGKTYFQHIPHLKKWQAEQLSCLLA